MLTKARNLIVAEMDAALKELDITSQQMGILMSIQDGLPATPFKLSKLPGIDTGLMTRTLDKLEESNGLQERSRSADDCRRKMKSRMSDSGIGSPTLTLGVSAVLRQEPI